MAVPAGESSEIKPWRDHAYVLSDRHLSVLQYLRGIKVCVARAIDAGVSDKAEAILNDQLDLIETALERMNGSK